MGMHSGYENARCMTVCTFMPNSMLGKLSIYLSILVAYCLYKNLVSPVGTAVLPSIDVIDHSDTDWMDLSLVKK